MAHWGYTKENGPDRWVEVAPAAAGTRQSPIDVQTAGALYDSSLADKPFCTKYVPANSKSVTNNGHSAQVTLDGQGSSLEGGPLSDKYEAVQFHFHWGNASDHGSEHTVDGETFAAEFHLVHYNTGLFGSFGEAASADNGLCVLGVLLKAGAENPWFNKLAEQLAKVPFSGDTVALDGELDPAGLLPADRSKYWTYPGSLTTPPCFESVTWVLFKDPVELSEEQLEKLRALNSIKDGEAVPRDELAGKIVENFRPPMPLHGRKVRASFQ